MPIQGSILILSITEPLTLTFSRLMTVTRVLADPESF